MSNAWHHFQAGGWAMWVIVIWVGLSFGVVFVLTSWLRRLWQRRSELQQKTWVLAAVLAGIGLVGAWGTLLGLAKAFAAVGGESIDPSQKARILAEGISEAMNCTAFGILFGLPSALALAVLTKKKPD